MWEKNLIRCFFFLFVYDIVCVTSFDLTLLRTNDVHARIEQFNIGGGECQDQNNCYGGVARRHTVVEEIRKNESNVILLDGGDRFTGTVWFSHYGGEEAAIFMNYTKYDTMAFGNHEFDKGPEHLAGFVKSLNFPVVSANLNASLEPSWSTSDKLNLKSTILERDGRKIGIIGYTTADTKWLSSPAPITFNDVIISIRKEVRSLQAKGINIIIALGHAGLVEDRKIAKEVDGLDIVVGGHSHTFLYTGSPPSNNIAEDVYPVVVHANDSTKTLIVQDFEFGKYLGYLKVNFDDKGELVKWSGNPILLDNKFKQDEEALKMVEDMIKPINADKYAVVGKSLVFLNGKRQSCRAMECNLGNLVTDALVKMNQGYPDNEYWANISLAIWNGGGIRGSIDKNKTEPITMSDLKTVLPFGKTADIVELTGKVLKEVFEHSASALPELEGRFLQVSGFRVIYNVNKPVGKRLIGLKALCIKCRVPKYEVVTDDQVYKVILVSYLVSGGDGYTMLKNVLKHQVGEIALSYVVDYVKKESPVIATLEDRIIFVNDDEKPCTSSSTTYSGSYILTSIFVFLYSMVH